VKTYKVTFHVDIVSYVDAEDEAEALAVAKEGLLIEDGQTVDFDVVEVSDDE
jgi:hypothetical protein